MRTAISKLKAHVAAGEWQKALSLAAKWPQLGQHRTAITRAWAALGSKNTYREMGYDVDELVCQGLRAIGERYSIDVTLALENYHAQQKKNK